MNILDKIINFFRRKKQVEKSKEEEEKEWVSCVACKWQDECCNRNFGYGCYSGETTKMK